MTHVDLVLNCVQAYEQQDCREAAWKLDAGVSTLLFLQLWGSEGSPDTAGPDSAAPPSGCLLAAGSWFFFLENYLARVPTYLDSYLHTNTATILPITLFRLPNRSYYEPHEH